MRVFFAMILLAVPAFAQERTHDVKPEDYFTLNTITEIAVSPDGKNVAYALATWDKAEDNRKSDVWVIATDGKGKPTKLTFDRANDRTIKWSGDGKHLYFLGNRKRAAETKPPYDGTTQVWRIDAAGGDAKAITRETGGVVHYDYAPKADAIYFSKDKEHADDDEFAKLRAKTKVEYGHGIRKVSEIHKLDLASWNTEKLVDETRYVREFVVTQDGKKIAMVSAFDDTVVKSEGESRVDVWESGNWTFPPMDVYRKNAVSPYAWLEHLCWSPSGDGLAFCVVFDAHPAEIAAMTWKNMRWHGAFAKRPPFYNIRGYGTPLRWPVDSELYYLCDKSDGLVSDFSCNPFKPEADPVLHVYEDLKYRNVSMLDFDSTGKVQGEVYGYPSRFPELRIYRKDHTTHQTSVNEHTLVWKLPSVQHITWKAPDGTEVGGVLELPPGYKKGDKFPLVVAIHGGPTTSTKAEMTFDPHNGRLYFAAAGYAVLFPNYRGSTGYGDKFVTDLIGRENDIEVKDILAGIQHLVKEGIADENRVGVMGWSNGGYLTNCLITLKDSPIKFKAASSGAGIVDTVAEWGFNDEPAYPIVFKKGLPWEVPENYKKTSPTYNLGNCNTPTLIHVGGGDERCPPGHSRMLYRALKENLKVPTELVVYTGEPHGLTKMSNRQAKMEWDLAWFDKFLKNAK